MMFSILTISCITSINLFQFVRCFWELETLSITIRHWETLSVHSVTLSKSLSYHIFEAQVGELLSDEIGSNDFRLYTLPFESDELDEKLRLTAENFSQFVDHKFACEKPRRNLYVSNTGLTPTKLPGLTIDNLSELSGTKRKSSLAGSKSTTTSNVSRSSKYARLCIGRDHFTCRVCQYYTDNEYAQPKQLEAAHIYEIEEQRAIPDEQTRMRTLVEMELYDINHPMNLITLFQVCHAFFDRQQIGIDPESKSWIITTSIANISTQSGRSYKAVHGSTAGFGALSNLALLVHRYERFTAKECSKNSVMETSGVSAEEMNGKPSGHDSCS